MPVRPIDTARLLTQAMRVSELTHRTIANNIANADTPFYNPVHVNFEETLSRVLEGRGGFALRTTHPRHLRGTSQHANFEGLASLSKNDYNKVDLDAEVAALAENTSRYTTYSRLLGRRFEMSRTMLNNLQR